MKWRTGRDLAQKNVCRSEKALSYQTPCSEPCVHYSYSGRDINMASQAARFKDALQNFVHRRIHGAPLPIAEWILLFMMWAISVLTLYLLWWKANPPL